MGSLVPPVPATMQRDVLPQLQGLKGRGPRAPCPATAEPRLLETRATFLIKTDGRILFCMQHR